MAKSTQRDFIVSIEGIPGNFRDFSGGGETSEATKDRDGGAIRQTMTPNPSEWEDIEVGRAYDPVLDPAWIREVRQDPSRTYTVSKQPTDVNKIAIGEPEVYPGCLRVGLKTPDVGDSSDHGMVTMTFANTGPAE